MNKPQEQIVTRRSSLLGQTLRQPGFVSCFTLLTVFAVSFQAWTSIAKIRFVTLPLELRKPLDRMDQAKLFPYEVLGSSTLKQEMVDSLGTDQYISWTLRDTSLKNGGPEQYGTLFVTYYTGKMDQVPHVPEACYVGSGYKVKDSSFRDVSIPALGPDYTVPIQVLELERSQLFGREGRVVLYTFQANGQFAPSRRDVQSVLSNPLDRYAYFSKLEITFGTPEQVPPKDVALAAGERLLRVVVPILVKEHWPDWEAAQKAATQPAGDTKKAPGGPGPAAHQAEGQKPQARLTDHSAINTQQ